MKKYLFPLSLILNCALIFALFFFSTRAGETYVVVTGNMEEQEVSAQDIDLSEAFVTLEGVALERVDGQMVHLTNRSLEIVYYESGCSAQEPALYFVGANGVQRDGGDAGFKCLSVPKNVALLPATSYDFVIPSYEQPQNSGTYFYELSYRIRDSYESGDRRSALTPLFEIE